MSLKIGVPAFGVVTEDTTNRSLLPNGPVKPYSPIDQNAVIADFGRRLAGLENAMKITVPADRVTSAIALTKDTALISSDKIAIVGEVTFADWSRDISGQSTGTIDPSITQIRGGVIRTEKVISFDGLSWLDLDAAGATPFIQCRDTVSIRANGAFTFGSTSGKQLIWDGFNLSVGSNSLLGSTPVSTVVSYANDVPNKLAKSGTDILSGQVSFQSSGAFKVGTPTIDGSGNVTGGTGLAFTSKGIVGISAGVVKFAIDVNGNATFAGDVITGGQVYANGVTNDGSGILASVIGTTSNSNQRGVYGNSTNFYGVHGNSIASTAVLGASVSGKGVDGVSIYGYGVSGSSIFNYAIYSYGTLKSVGNVSFDANLTTASFMGYSSPGNIIATTGSGTPTNTTTPVAWIQVRTLANSATYYQPLYL